MHKSLLTTWFFFGSYKIRPGVPQTDLVAGKYLENEKKIIFSTGISAWIISFPPSNILNCISFVLILWFRTQLVLVFGFHCCFFLSCNIGGIFFQTGLSPYHPNYLWIAGLAFVLSYCINNLVKLFLVLSVFFLHMNKFYLPKHCNRITKNSQIYIAELSQFSSQAGWD